MMEEQRIIGIDFGEKRIGIALTDPLMTFAYAHTTLQNNKNLWRDLSNIIKEMNVKKAVLGLPSNEKNLPLINKIKEFKIRFENRFSLEVVEWNEEFTSVIAQERIIESVASKKKRRDKGLIDRNSAAIILQEYLESL